MKKIMVLILPSFLFLTACSSDEYAELRKMTVQDYLDNKTLMTDVLDKCENREIKDADICDTAKQAIQRNYSIFN